MSHELWHEIYDFLVYEATVLDERRFDEWLHLLTDDIFYWMPIRSVVGRNNADAEVTKLGELAYFEEDKDSLKMRVARLDTGMAWAEDPPTRTRHVISNLVVDAGPADNEVTAHCAIILYRTALEREVDLFVGNREDVLRREEGGWRIAKRTVVLDQTVLGAKNLSNFF